jgi:exodeoxyribonuclease V alpha subunit
MNVSLLFDLLKTWHEAGWLRSLDLAFARFVQDIEPDTPAGLLLAAALLAQLEGRGHSCLPLDELVRDPVGTMGWPDAARQGLTTAVAECGGWPAAAMPSQTQGQQAEAWRGVAAVQVEPEDDRGRSPLVLSGRRLYLRRHWRQETRLAAALRQRVRQGAGERAAAGAGPADIAVARHMLDRLFPPEATTDCWQKLACALALRGRLTLITGGPGTGKTWTAARLLVLLQAVHDSSSKRLNASSESEALSPLRVALAAPTGKAAARLRQSIAAALRSLPATVSAPVELLGTTPSLTLHALLGARFGTRQLARDADHPLAIDLLIVDEASMVPLEMMAALFDALPASARVVLLGDRDQLASVESGDVLGDLCRGTEPGQPGFGYRADTVQWLQAAAGVEPPADSLGDGSDLAQQTVMLRTSRRFAGPIGRLAGAVNDGDAAAALRLLGPELHAPVALLAARQADQLPALALNGRTDAADAQGYGVWLRQLAGRPQQASGFEDWATAVLHSFDSFRVLCAVREGPWGVTGLNAAIERLFVERGLLRKRGEWYEGRPVVVTRNDSALGVFNGDIGIALRSPRTDGDGAGGLRVWFAGGEGLRSLSVARLADVETAFAMTVHKSQGSEFGHVLMVLPDEDRAVLTRELVYTGITRARLAFTLVAADAAVLERAIGRRTRRFSGLADRLAEGLPAARGSS